MKSAGSLVRVRVGRLHASRAWRPCPRFVLGRSSVRFRLEALFRAHARQTNNSVQCACIAARAAPWGRRADIQWSDPWIRCHSAVFMNRTTQDGGSPLVGYLVNPGSIPGAGPSWVGPPTASPHPLVCTVVPPDPGGDDSACDTTSRASDPSARVEAHRLSPENELPDARPLIRAAFPHDGPAPSHPSTTRSGGEPWTTRSISQLGCVGS